MESAWVTVRVGIVLRLSIATVSGSPEPSHSPRYTRFQRPHPVFPAMVFGAVGDCLEVYNLDCASAPFRLAVDFALWALSGPVTLAHITSPCAFGAVVVQSRLISFRQFAR